MEGFCRGCLIQFEPSELLQYTEKNRRLFIYCTGIQVKRNDTFTFQLCKDCNLNMKVACKFKKSCKNSDKKLRKYLALKDVGENVDFPTFFKNNDDSMAFGFPLTGNSTPCNSKPKDDDNESTCTSIQNFISDIMESEEIPATEARIIREVIEEEADILDDSIDSQWLQDDVSIDTDFKLDFSFSPFVTPQYVNEGYSYTPKKLDNEKSMTVDLQNLNTNNEVTKNICEKLMTNLEHFNDMGSKCTIDKNLENALNNANENISLHDLLVTPPLHPGASGPPTPLITNILFGDKLDDDSVDSYLHNVGQCIEEFAPVQGDTESLEDFLAEKAVDLKIEVAENINLNNEIRCNLGENVIEKIIDGENSETKINNNVKNKGKQCIEDFELAQNDNKLLEEFLEEKPDVRTEELNKEWGIREVKTDTINKLDNNRNNLKDKTASTTGNKNTVTNFYCKMCKKVFKSLCALKVHSAKVHKQKINYIKPHPRKNRICDYCGKSYYNVNSFRSHIESHIKPPVPERCLHCSQTFSTKSRLKMHMSTHLGKSKPKRVDMSFVCSICGATSSSANNLRLHLRRHSKNYVATCEECGKGFYRKSDLTTHYRHHTGEKPFSCEHCNCSFSRRDVLNRHMKRHTGEKAFDCQFCNLSFITTHELKVHQITACVSVADLFDSEENYPDKSDVTVYYEKVIGTDVLLEDFDGTNDLP